MQNIFLEVLTVPKGPTLSVPAFGARQQSQIPPFEVIFNNLKKVPRACFTHRIQGKVELTCRLGRILQG